MNTALSVLALIVSLVALGLVLLGRRSAASQPVSPPQPPPPPPAPPPPPKNSEIEDGAARRRLDQVQAAGEETTRSLRSLAERVDRLESDWGREAEALQTALGQLRSALDPLQEAVEGLSETQRQAVTAAEAEPEEEAEVDPEIRVREHLREAGWEDVVLLPAEPSAWRVEARRGGSLEKGRARLYPDGRVEARLAPPTRAFP